MVWLGCIMLVTSKSQVWFHCCCYSWIEGVFGHDKTSAVRNWQGLGRKIPSKARAGFVSC